MIHWHSLLTQRSPQQGAFPGKTSGPLFVDATLLIQPAAWFRKHHGKAGQNLPGTCGRCWPAIRRSVRVRHFQHLLYYRTKTWMQKQTENVFSVLTCAIHSRTARVKNVAQIWLHRASIPGIADLDSCCKNGIASLSQLYSTLWLTGAKNSVSGKDVKNNAPNVATEECRRQYRSIHYRHDSGDELNFVVAGPHFPGVM